jgi:hypothetical protein
VEIPVSCILHPSLGPVHARASLLNKSDKRNIKKGKKKKEEPEIEMGKVRVEIKRK